MFKAQSLDKAKGIMGVLLLITVVFHFAFKRSISALKPVRDTYFLIVSHPVLNDIPTKTHGLLDEDCPA